MAFIAPIYVLEPYLRPFPPDDLLDQQNILRILTRKRCSLVRKMASMTTRVDYCTPVACLKLGQESSKQKLQSLKVNVPSQENGLAGRSIDNMKVSNQLSRLNIPTEKQLEDPFRLGIFVEGVKYKQTFVIRANEIGPDKTATLESILNLFQDSGLNHIWMSGLQCGDSFGVTHAMMRQKLIWVITRMQLEVDVYPIWGEVIEVVTWAGASGKNGMRRDFLLKSQATGLVFARATSKWILMNMNTRRLTKMTDDVRAEFCPWLSEERAIEENHPEKIDKLDSNARNVCSDLKPDRSDLDVNYHVNNVKYVKWMLETLSDEFVENHQLSSIILEYRRECWMSDVVQSLSEPIEDDMLSDHIVFNGYSTSSSKGPYSYTHLLQTQGDSKNEEIVRGKTTWKKKTASSP